MRKAQTWHITNQLVLKLLLLGFTIGGFSCIQLVAFEATIGSTAAWARSSGGRSRGGTFRSAPPRSSSPSTPQRQPSQSQPRYDDRRQPSYYPPVVPIPIPNSYPNSYPNNYPSNTTPSQTNPAPPSSTQNNNANSTVTTDYSWLLWLGGATGLGGLAWWYWASRSRNKAAKPGSAEEISNDIVSVTEVQVALLANSPIQKELTEIVQTMAIDTPAQLKEQFQTVVVSLLRLPEYWSHALVSSQTFPNRTEAEGYFEQWSIKQRSNLTQETLTRDSLGLRQRELTINPEKDPAAYVVVSLLIGTTHDRPLVDKVYSADDLKAGLEKLSAISEEELLVFELIWTPQDATDSLSRDELLSEFGNLVMV